MDLNIAVGLGLGVILLVLFTAAATDAVREALKVFSRLLRSRRPKIASPHTDRYEWPLPSTTPGFGRIELRVGLAPSGSLSRWDS